MSAYVLIVWPTDEADDDGPDAYGPLTLADATQARESVLRGTPDAGIEIAMLHPVANLFERLPLP